MGTLGGEAASPCLSAAARCPVTVCACRAFCCFGVSLLARFSGSLSLQGVISSELEQPMLQLTGRELGRGPWCCRVPSG